MQVYQGVVVTKENDKGVAVGAVGVVVGANDPVDVRFDDPAGKHASEVIGLPADCLRVL